MALSLPPEIWRLINDAHEPADILSLSQVRTLYRQALDGDGSHQAILFSRALTSALSSPTKAFEYRPANTYQNGIVSSSTHLTSCAYSLWRRSKGWRSSPDAGNSS